MFDKLFEIQTICGIVHFITIFIVIIYLYKKNSITNEPVKIISLIVLVGFITSVFKHYFMGTYLRLPYPENTFLFNPADKFNDFINMLNCCKENNPYQTSYWLPSVYFPIANTFFYLMSLFKTDNFALIVYFLAFSIILSTYIKNKMKDIELMDLIIIFGMAYPLLFNIDRMNLEMMIFILLLFFTELFFKKKYFQAAILLSIPVGMKLYPAVFALLFLKEKRYKEFGLFILITILISIISLASFHGTVIENIIAFKVSLSDFKQSYSSIAGLQHNVSLYGMIKIILFSFGKTIVNLDNEQLNLTLNSILKYPYLIIVAIYTLIITISVVFIKKELWKDLFLIISTILLLPHVSFDYKLIHLYIPLILFITQKNADVRKIKSFSVLFGLLIINNSYIYLHGDISIGVLLNPVVILGMVFLIMQEEIVTLQLKIKGN